jgi:peptide deformylase
MSVREIVVWPDPRLREETQAIAVAKTVGDGGLDDSVRALYRDLCDTMFAYNGIGIAAIQIGVPLKMFLLEASLLGGAETDDPIAFINPEVLETSEETEKIEEGCLSFPGIYVPIARPFRARVRAVGIDGKVFEIEGEGLLARAIQHENDHLTGKLMVDFVGPLKRQMIKRKLNKREPAELPVT